MNTVLDTAPTQNETCLKNLAKEATIIATNDTISNAYNLVDGKDDTYWTTDGCNAINSYVELNFKEEKEFNTIELNEYVPYGENVDEFKIYAYRNNQWFDLYNGSNIGHKYLAKFPNVKTSKIKISFLKYYNSPTISNLGIYKM